MCVQTAINHPQCNTLKMKTNFFIISDYLVDFYLPIDNMGFSMISVTDVNKCPIIIRICCGNADEFDQKYPDFKHSKSKIQASNWSGLPAAMVYHRVNLCSN